MRLHLSRHLSLGILAAALAFGAPALAQSQQQEIDMRLRSAGFKVRPAATAQEIDLLRRAPPRVMLSRTDQGRRYYLFADPDFCKCVYAGDEQALRTYRETSMSPNPPPPATETPIRELDAALGQTALFGPPF
jgi:hypothetical protein